MDKYKFGEYLYNQRKKVGLTQEELGRRLKVTNKAVSKWETGETFPDVLLLKPLANELQITVDELLTQQKPEPEKVIIKPKKLPYFIMGGIIAVLLIISTVLSINLFSNSEVIVTLENVNEYYQVNLYKKAVLEDKALTIKGSINEIGEITDAKLSIDVSIQYFYLNNDDELCEILYLNRNVTYDETTNDFEITVSPKNTIDDFKSFYGFNVSYKIIDVEGVVSNEK